MTFQNVPSEVLDQIFQLLPQSSIWTCITVCKNWNSTAARVYYTTLCLNTKQAAKLINSLADETHIFQSISRGLWVKHLILTGEGSSSRFSLSQDKFQKLLSFLSYLKVIDLCAIEEKNDLIAYLGTFANYEKLSDQQQQQDKEEEGLPSSIEEIKIDLDVPREAKELHLLANYAYRASITHLTLNYLKKNIGGKGSSYLDLLPQFASLTHLSIYNDLLNGDRYMVIYNILEACPRLKSFQLHTTRHFPDGSQPILLRFIEQDLQQQQQQQQQHQASLGSCHPTSNIRHQSTALATTNRSATHYTNIKKTYIHLKDLNFHIHGFDEAYMKYIIYYTPKQLSSFKLHLSDTNFYDWLIEKDSVVNQFGLHLSNVNNLEITAYTPGMIPRRRDGLLRPAPTITEVTAQEKMMRHWIFIHNVIGGQHQQQRNKLHTHVYLAITGYHDFQNFKLKKVDNLLILKYALKPTYPHNNLISVLTPHTMVGCENAGPNMIDSLEVGDAVRYTLQDCLDTVKYALKYCPKLKFVLIHRAESCFRIEALSVINMEFDKIKIPIGQGREYIKEKHSFASEDEGGLNHVSLTGTDISPELVSMLTQFIPNMQVLILTGCTLPMQEDDNGRKNVTFNLKGIRHLHYLQIDLIHTVMRPFDFTFIKFELQEGTFCYKSKNSFDDQEMNFIPMSVQDFLLEKESVVVVVKKEVVATFITIQCQKLDAVALKTGVNDLNPSILKPGVDLA